MWKQLLLCFICLLVVVYPLSVSFSQQESQLTWTHDGAGRQVPESLMTRISICLNEVSLEDALIAIADQGNFELNYNRNHIPIKKPVSVNVKNNYALVALQEVLDATNTDLMVTREGHLVIVPAQDGKRLLGEIAGRVVDGETGMPLEGTNVMIVGSTIGCTTGLDGRYILENLRPGPYSVRFDYIGYKTKRVNDIRVARGGVVHVDVDMEQQAILLRELTVTPSQFSIMGEVPTFRQSLTHEDMQTITWGEDTYRAITRLPGISSSDFSAKFTVRGGENDQILVQLDGMELYEPFHLKDIEGGALSIIDVDAIEGIDLLTGGFTAEYGNRMSGVFNMKSTRIPSGRQRTSMGLSLMNVRVMSEGTFSNNRGSWLFSARRGYLDIVLDLMEEENQPSPRYYDVLGRIDYRLNETLALSAHVLHAGDRLSFTEDDDDVNETSYDNSYAWLTLKSTPSSRLFIQTVASYGRLNTDRDGIAYTGDLSAVDFVVRDKRYFDFYGLKQDWNLELSEKWVLKWGFDLKHFNADYDYFSTKRRSYYTSYGNEVVWIDTTRVDIWPSGNRVGGYLANRFRVLQPLTMELGLRYDWASYTEDRLFSPRVNIVWSMGKQTFIRVGWGHFYQSQDIHQIRVQEGEHSFYPASLAEHWVAGFEHHFNNGIHIRLEGYNKRISDLNPDYRNWSNSIEFFPELQGDRFRLNILGATAEGIEAFVKYDPGGKVSLWASYALSRVDNDIRSLVYQGIEYTENSGQYPGRYDQRHTVYFDMNIRPSRHWLINFSWQFHSGWPYTALELRSFTMPDGSTAYYSEYANFYGANYSSYHRLDMRVNRHFYTSKGRVSVFFGLINVYNRGNVMNIDYWWEFNHDGTPYLVAEKDYWFRLLPSLGISWSWVR
jgi:hypothetical protein